MRKRARSLIGIYLYDLPISAKFLLAVSILLFAEIFVLNNYIRKEASALLTEELQITSRQFVEQYMDNINFRLVRFDTLLNSFCSNSRIRNLLSVPSPDASDYEDIETEIRGILNDQFPYALYDLTFYPVRQEGFPEHSGSFIKPADPGTLQWLSEKASAYSLRFFINPENPFGIKLLTAVRPVYSIDGASVICYIKLSLFPEKVFKLIEPVKGNSISSLFIIGSQGDPIYGYSEMDTDSYLVHIQENFVPLYIDTRIPDFSDHRGIYITSDTSSHGYRAVCRLDFEETRRGLLPMNRAIICSILIIMLIMCVLGFTLSISINRRFGITMRKIDSFKRGDMNVRETQTGKDEIAVFDQSFTQMVQEVNQLINDRYISEMQKKNAELMALQAQINPHFLFNSLEIVNSLIEIGQCGAAAEANSCLSSLLRYSISYHSSGIVTLAEEIAYVKNYIHIQKLRFPDSFLFETEIDESCLNWHIIKLVLQPIIENSFRYGLSNLHRRGMIRFQLQDAGEFIQITISDNGHGMAEEDCKKLLDKLNSSSDNDFVSSGNGIGLLNIHSRLKLKYGSAYKLQILTNKEKGMATYITIPKQ